MGDCNILHLHYHLALTGHCVEVQMGQLDYQQFLLAFVVFATCASVRLLKGVNLGIAIFTICTTTWHQQAIVWRYKMGQLDCQQLFSVFVVFASCVSVRFLKGGEFGNCNIYHLHYHLAPTGHCVEVQNGANWITSSSCRCSWYLLLVLVSDF